MQIRFNKTGEERKALVKAIGEFLCVKPRYLRIPTYAYEIGAVTVDRYGTMELDENDTNIVIDTLLDYLAKRGFTAETTEAAEAPEEKPEECVQAQHSEDIGLTVAVPIDCVNVSNLKALLSSKGYLIKEALGIDELPVEVREDVVEFPWFSSLPDRNTAKAVTHLISSLCEMSIKQKRINSTETVAYNHKYAFRCFLLRLGFIGEDYKEERKTLLKNLSGSSAFRNEVKNYASTEA